MNSAKITLRDHLRMIWTIAAKDILDALKNKTTITVIVSALFVVVLYRVIPILTSAAEAPELIIADLGGSALVEKMADSQAFLLFSRPDEPAMLKRAAASEAPNLALVIPPGFDQMLAEGRPPELQGYSLYWVKPAKAVELRQQAEAELSRLAGLPVKITARLTSIYPAPVDNPLANWAGMALVFVLIMINLQLIPNLMLEEKQTHTLDALLISPASAWDLAAGKALTGLFYSFLGAAVILAAYANQILQWGLIIMAVLIVSLLLAPLGLLVGQKVENRAQLGIWVWIIMIPLLAPVLIILIAEFFPAIVIQIARLFPTGAAMKLVLSSFGQTIAPGEVILDLGIMLLWMIPLVGLLVWSVLRMDRPSSARVGKARPSLAAHSTVSEPEKAGAANQGLDEPVASGGLLNLEAVLPVSIDTVSRPGSLRIILTIAAKDLRESFRNRVALLIIVTSLLMILLNSALPLLLRNRVEPAVLIYDAGRSELGRVLAKQADPRVLLTRTQQEMEDEIGDLPQTYLGLSLPVDFDQRLANGETINLEGILVHWADPETAARLASQFSAAVARLTPGAVSIAGRARIVYPALVGFGQAFMVAQVLTFILLIIGLSLVPILLVDEKETHTIEALLVSPARPEQVVIGKALVGFFYGFLAAAVVILLNGYLFVNWGVLLLAVLAGMAFAVALGLLIGALSNNPTTVGLWGGMALMLLIATGLLSLFSNANWPAWLRELLYWLPSGAMIRLIRSAMLAAPPLWIVLGGAGVLLGLAAVIYALTALRLRRMLG